MNPFYRAAERFRALSRRERLLLLLCAVAVALFALARFVAYPAIDSYRRAKSSIPHRVNTIARYRLAVQGEGKLDEAIADAAEKLDGLQDGILPGDTPAAAGAVLQGIVKPWLERPDTRLTSIRNLPPVRKGDYAEVVVQMDLQTSTEGLAAILSQVPRHPKVLRVKKFSVQSGYYGPGLQNRRETLQVTVVVAGLADASLDTREE